MTTHYPSIRFANHPNTQPSQTRPILSKVSTSSIPQDADWKKKRRTNKSIAIRPKPVSIT